MLHFESVEDAEGHGTILPSSIAPFSEFYKKPFQGSPVEACWNAVTSAYSPGTDSVKTTKTIYELHYLCLRPFTDNYKNPTDAFLMKITNKGERSSVIKEFYNYLLSSGSPWAEARNSIATVGKDKHGIPNAILWYNTGNTSSKLIVNLLTTMRLHTCWGLDFIWRRLVEAGFTPEEAILLCTNFSWAGQALTISNGPSSKFSDNPYKSLALSRLGVSKTDMPFLTNYNPSGFLPLLNKEPNLPEGSLQSGQSPQPNSYIWNTDKKEINADNLRKSSGVYKNATVVVSKKSTPLYDFLKKQNTKLPKDYVKEVQEKLRTNSLLEV